MCSLDYDHIHAQMKYSSTSVSTCLAGVYTVYSDNINLANKRSIQGVYCSFVNCIYTSALNNEVKQLSK